MVFTRMDGVPLGLIDVATKKARTAALFHMDSADLATIARPDGGLHAGKHQCGLTSFGGGLVLRGAHGSVVGAIGVSGAPTEDDIAIARIAANTLGA
ncbi:GlcG/HbpS family heme-binding protein [Komagataeibacter xylinus]|uniref:GlcG/HbpS family heme-binding protein n=1 Tax=Komagataeibacter xylinus TaxID=28448 RepID=UPI0038D03D2C